MNVSRFPYSGTFQASFTGRTLTQRTVPYLTGYKPCLNQQYRTLLRVQTAEGSYHRAYRIFRLDDKVLNGICSPIDHKGRKTNAKRVYDSSLRSSPADLQGRDQHRKIFRDTTHAHPMGIH